MNPNWYSEMETAKPLSVNREMLYVLAEMRLEMYRQRLIEERLLATVSIMQMQMARTLTLPMLEGMAKQIQKSETAS